ncbi:MAG: tetratricopeptide repeat protein [Waddliaceae bacterium]|nr:tetratricopeptide repeat protein [Waddliaceae bacterium]MBT3579151.1 tetratricopeptide repeat protein [Waddliaceae bacterium]MBT4444307.1 tetratricopeptide repeat protein [Waddliaceae bacterium]MBT6928522.1 tetratricopeptide repeat protein [Waddliaceae bacterium]MBT7264860.1 tetratricopeptide repeat protein [Waddliaceae bacterium]
MVYFIVVFFAIVSGLFSLRFWLLYRHRASHAISDALENAERLVALRDWDAADAVLSPLVAVEKGGFKTSLFYSQVLRGTKQWEKALSFLDKALINHPSHPSLLQERARVLMESGNYDEALKALNSRAPLLRNEDDFFDLASALFHNDKPFEAWDVLKNITETSRNGRLLALAGDCHFSWRGYDKALVLYLRSQECGWSNHHVLYRIGFCHKSLRHWDDAERCFSEIVRLDDSATDAVLGLGECFEAKGFFNKALILYRSVEAWNLGDANILHQAGICSVMTQQYDHGRLYLQAALKKGVRSPQLLAFLGYCLEQHRLWEDAEGVYLKLADAFPRHVSGYLSLAWLYGVGLSSSLSDDDGLAMAHQAVMLNSSPLSWEILSACEARAGNFTKAHHIQECLSSYAQDKDTRRRRQQAMRILRKKLPLTEDHISKVLVA